MLKIGEKIKELRKAQDVTQEKLADYLNISYQAVSKWENGLALPDITLLPKLANFFGVTSDELLSINPTEDKSRLDEYYKLYRENNRQGKMMENIVLARKVLDEYPRNFQWMLNLAYPLVQYEATDEQKAYSREHKFIEEATALCERILEDCTEESTRQSAINILCYNYPRLGKTEDALRLANQMPEMLLSKEPLLFHIYKGEEKIAQAQKNLLSMIDMSAGLIWVLTSNELMGKELSIEDKIKFIKTAINLFQLVLDGDENSLFYNCRLCRYYEKLASLYCMLGDEATALENLKLAEATATAYDKCENLGEEKYRSLFANRQTFNPKTVGKNWEGTECQMLLDYFENKCYDILRDNKEFIEIQNRLKNL